MEERSKSESAVVVVEKKFVFSYQRRWWCRVVESAGHPVSSRVGRLHGADLRAIPGLL